MIRAGHSVLQKNNDDIDTDILQKSNNGTNNDIFKKKITTVTILGTDFRYFSNEKVFCFFQQNYALK